MAESVEKLCHPKLSQYWFKKYWDSTNGKVPEELTPLMIGSYFGLTSTVRDCINKDPDSLNCGDSIYQRTALCWAAKNGFADVVRLLIKGTKIKFALLTFTRQKASLNSVDRFGRTALFYAVMGGHIDMAKVLLDAGAYVNNKDKMGGTEFSYAVCIGDDRLIDLLLRMSARAIASDLGDLLISAVDHKDEETVALLLNNGDVQAQVNKISASRMTSLTLAARLGYGQIVGILLGKGQADPDAKNGFGHTALMIATESSHQRIVEILLDEGKADPEAKENDGQTALIRAARWGWIDAVEILLDKGKANTQSNDNDGKPALMWATENGHEGVASILRSRLWISLS